MTVGHFRESNGMKHWEREPQSGDEHDVNYPNVVAPNNVPAPTCLMLIVECMSHTKHTRTAQPVHDEDALVIAPQDVQLQNN